MDLKINEIFKKLIDPLSEEEYTQLKENIRRDGIREPLSVWNGFIIDGHNRYQIANELGSFYSIKEYQFENEEEVKRWILMNQLGRRNLTPAARANLALQLKDSLREMAKLNQATNTKNHLDKKTKTKPINVRKEIADLANVSETIVTGMEKINKSAIEDVKQATLKGDISVRKGSEIASKPKDEQKELLEKAKDKSIGGSSKSAKVEKCGKNGIKYLICELLAALWGADGNSDKESYYQTKANLAFDSMRESEQILVTIVGNNTPRQLAIKQLLLLERSLNE